MSRRFSFSFLGGLMAAILVLFGVSAPSAWAQAGSQGTVAVTVVDQSGGVVSGTQLELQNIATNDVRNAVTQDKGTYSFVNLPIGTYKLTASKGSFQTQVFDAITVQAAQVTDISVSLKVAAVAGEKVVVSETATPLIDTTSNAIGTTIDLKQIEDLPLGGRDLGRLTQLTPGFTGTWSGLPATAQGNNVDGVDSSTNRMKFAGTTSPDVSVRLESIQEMTVQTSQIDANQGFGQAAMQISYVTRSGSNSFHGRAFDDFQNAYLNANSWFNDAIGQKKGKFILNDFGGSLGGPILKNKLFFFGTYAENKNPGTPNLHNATVLTAPTQLGNYSYIDGNGVTQTVNVFTLAQQWNAANPLMTPLPTSINSTIASELATVNGVLANGTLSSNAPGDLNTQTISWLTPQPLTNYYPAIRLDYNVSQNLRVNFAWNMTKQEQPGAGAPPLPGAAFTNQTTNSAFKFYTTALGIDWTIRPTLINSFRGGFLYHWDGFTAGADAALFPNNVVNWAYGTSGVTHNTNLTDYYPLFTASDTVTWQHGAHTWNFGFSYNREQDHYWNAPSGWNNIDLYLSGLDPANGAFTDPNNSATPTLPGASDAQLGGAQNLYATLVGRIGDVNSQYAYDPNTGTYNHGVASYNLDELQRSWGLFGQDSFRVRPNLTVNYALRWDFTGDDHDLTNFYHGVASAADLYGPSGYGNLFMPGVLQGQADPSLRALAHQYKPWNKSPQPSIGIAWSPQFSEGMLGKLAGSGTVIRAGYQFRNFTEPYQYFWDNATDYGGFYYQFGNLNARSTPGLGNFVPGSLELGVGAGNIPTGPVPNYFYNPATYTSVVPMDTLTFQGHGLSGFNPNIKQPYNQSWNLGIQRQLGRNNAIEVRYEGGRSVHQWAAYNLNEVNIFQPGSSSFLAQFQQAQTNLRVNNALAAANPGNAAEQGYKGSFAYQVGAPGEAATPVFDTAFATDPGPLNGQGYGDTTYTRWLRNGQAGTFAGELANPDGNAPGYFCNLVGTSFSPCVNSFGATNVGTYPINYFQVNPYFGGTQYFPGDVPYMTNGAYSTYEALVVDFRQKQWHGMQFDANYAYSQNLADGPFNGSWTGNYNEFSLRRLRMGYTPSNFDFHHVMHINGTYDLPFGKGKQFLNQSSLLDRAVGGWTIGTIFTWQSGLPFSLGGGRNTFNDFQDGGVNLIGISRDQLQSAMGLYRVTPATFQANGGTGAAPFVLDFNPAILNTAVGGARQSLLTANTTPGTLNSPIYLIGPRQWNDDLAVTKIVTIRENLRFSLQGEFLNAFNHVNFGNPGSGALDTNGFGQAGPANGPRVIELRANLEF